MGTLKLDQPGDLTGAITGLVAGDAIDLAGVQATSAVVSGSTLTVTAGAQTYKYQVSGSGLATNTFAMEDDQHGGTDLVLGPPGPTISSPDSQTAFLGLADGARAADDRRSERRERVADGDDYRAERDADGGGRGGGDAERQREHQAYADGRSRGHQHDVGGGRLQRRHRRGADNVQIAVTDANNATAAQTVAVTTDTVPFTDLLLNYPGVQALINNVYTAMQGVSVSDPYAASHQPIGRLDGRSPRSRGRRSKRRAAAARRFPARAPAISRSLAPPRRSTLRSAIRIRRKTFSAQSCSVFPHRRTRARQRFSLHLGIG